MHPSPSINKEALGLRSGEHIIRNPSRHKGSFECSARKCRSWRRDHTGRCFNEIMVDNY